MSSSSWLRQLTHNGLNRARVNAGGSEKPLASRRRRSTACIVSIIIPVLLLGGLPAYMHRERAGTPGGFSDAPVSRLLTTVVGPRRMTSHYSAHNCTSAQFLDAVAGIKVNPTGSSAVLPTNYTFAPSAFQFSFQWPGTCPRPHIYSQAEACDLLGAFGGVLLRGDSLTRHLSSALMIILKGKRDGAVNRMHDVCWGDRMFDDRNDCRKAAIASSTDATFNSEPLCGGGVQFLYQPGLCPVEPVRYITEYLRWRSGLGTRTSGLSTVILQAFGLHCGLDAHIPVFGVLKPLLAHAAHSFPGPLPL